MEISSIQGNDNYQNMNSNVTNHHNNNSIDNNKSEIKTQQEELKKEDDSTQKEKIKDKLKSLTEKLNKELDPLNTSVKFGFNDKVDEMVVDVIDKKTDKVVRKIPSDEALNLMAKMREVVGMLFDKKG